jgi:iron(III) transport system ATP-binding protein
MTPALSFRNVSCRFDGADVVDDVSFDIHAGEVVCLLGPSGCGKTTSLRLAAGMEVPSLGEIYLNGACVSSANQMTPPEARGIGFLFQDFALFPHLSVYENVTFGLGALSGEEQKRRALELLNAVGLSGFANKYPDTLSGGEQQRAALARAMAAKPKLVLMDEPFSNLDPQLRDQMRDLTLRLLRENDAAGLIVTHDAADALRMADRIAVQNKGRILQIDTPEAIYQNPLDLHVAAMFGPLNIMADKETGDQIGVRPSDMALAGKAKDFSVQGDVQNVRAIGPDWLCDITLSEGLFWQALVRGGERPEMGTNKFFVPRARLMLFKTQ